MEIREKALQLINKFGKSAAQEVCNVIIAEYSENKWDQDRIDFYLYVKNQITKIGKHDTKRIHKRTVQ